MHTLFCNKKIVAKGFTSSDTILNVMLNVFRNIDWDLITDTEYLQDTGFLDQKPRKFYNYALCRMDKLSNLRRLDSKTLSIELDTLENFATFHKSIFYHGKARPQMTIVILKPGPMVLFLWS